MAERYEYNLVEDGNLELGKEIWRAQTATPLEGHRITSLKIKVKRYVPGRWPGTVTVSIKATDGSGHPTGGDLCSGQFNGDALSDSTYTLKEVTLGEGAELQEGVKYAQVVRAPGASHDDALSWRCSFNNPYPRGQIEYSMNSGGSWTGYPTGDFVFEDWGVPLIYPPEIETQDATAIKSDEAMLHTKVIDDRGKTLSVRHNWGKTTAYGENTPWQEGKHTNDVISQKITDLDPETEYHFRGEAVYED